MNKEKASQARKKNNPEQSIKQNRQEKQWEKAMAARKEAVARQKHRRFIILGIIVLVLIIIIALLAGMWAGKKKEADASGLHQISHITFVGKSVGEPQSSMTTVDLFSDYSCPACILFEKLQGKQLFQLVRDNKIALRVHPVLTHGKPLAYVATDAVNKVAKGQPDKVQAFYQAVMEKTYEIAIKLSKTGNPDTTKSALTDLDMAKQMVDEVAKQQGVSHSIISSFDPQAAQNELKSDTQEWINYSKKHGENEPGTPAVWVKNKLIDMTKYPKPGSFAEALKKGEVK